MQPELDLVEREMESNPAEPAVAAAFAPRAELVQYAYQARSASGQWVAGTQVASDELELDGRLHDKGLVLISAKRANRAAGAGSVRMSRV